jgi:hypothetical protein
VRLEALRKVKKSNGLIGNTNRDLPACSIVPQPIPLPREATKVLLGRNVPVTVPH